MSSYNEVSKETASIVAKEIADAANEILARHGLEKSKQTAKYGSVFKITIEANATNWNERGVNLASPEAQAWLSFGGSYGFKNPAEALGQVFSVPMKGAIKTFKLIGLNGDAERFPVVVQDVTDGTKSRLTHVTLKFIEGWSEYDVASYNRRDLAMSAK